MLSAAVDSYSNIIYRPRQNVDLAVANVRNGKPKRTTRRVAVAVCANAGRAVRIQPDDVASVMFPRF